MTYKDKQKDTELKRKIVLPKIDFPDSVEKRAFRLKSNKINLILRAKNEEEKNKWIEAITVVKNRLIETGEVVEEEEEPIPQTNTKNNKGNKNNFNTNFDSNFIDINDEINILNKHFNLNINGNKETEEKKENNEDVEKKEEKEIENNENKETEEKKEKKENNEDKEDKKEGDVTNESKETEEKRENNEDDEDKKEELGNNINKETE